MADIFIALKSKKVKPAFEPSESRRAEYEKIYDKLMERGRSRKYQRGQHERHHIIPKSLGGLNLKQNITCLTYREHFLAHWLLTKVKVGAERQIMLFALKRMINKCRTHDERVIAGWQYAVARQAYSQAMLGNKYGLYTRTEEHKRNQSQRMKGNAFASYKHSEERRKRQSLYMTGNLKSITAMMGNKSRPKPVCCVTDGNLFPSIKTASEFYGVNAYSIGQVCLGHQANVDGLQFRYA